MPPELHVCMIVGFFLPRIVASDAVGGGRSEHRCPTDFLFGRFAGFWSFRPPVPLHLSSVRGRARNLRLLDGDGLFSAKCCLDGAVAKFSANNWHIGGHFTLEKKSAVAFVIRFCVRTFRVCCSRTLRWDVALYEAMKMSQIFVLPPPSPSVDTPPQIRIKQGVGNCQWERGRGWTQRDCCSARLNNTQCLPRKIGSAELFSDAKTPISTNLHPCSAQRRGR